MEEGREVVLMEKREDEIEDGEGKVGQMVQEIISLRC